jgi:ribosomal-protein-alanine N-acetyltransferase
MRDAVEGRMTIEEAFRELPALSTRRMRLRQIRMEDAPALHEFKSEPSYCRWFGEAPQATVEETAAWILSNLDAFSRREAMTWAMTFADDVAVGECCLWNFDAGHLRAEIGYELGPRHWHKGLMTEALEALLDYGFAELGLNRVEADTLATNTSSVALLRRLGMMSEGVLRQRHYFDGGFQDQALFSVLRDEWAGRARRDRAWRIDLH